MVVGFGVWVGLGVFVGLGALVGLRALVGLGALVGLVVGVAVVVVVDVDVELVEGLLDTHSFGGNAPAERGWSCVICRFASDEEVIGVVVG